MRRVLISTVLMLHSRATIKMPGNNRMAKPTHDHGGHGRRAAKREGMVAVSAIPVEGDKHSHVFIVAIESGSPPGELPLAENKAQCGECNPKRGEPREQSRCRDIH